MIGFAIGGIVMGRVADRFDIFVPLVVATVMLGIGYAAASQAQSIETFMLAQAILIGMMESAATFGPMVADVSLWFDRRRGIAVAIVASGNYLAGTIWPPILTYAMQTIGWRDAHLYIGIFCVVTMLPCRCSCADVPTQTTAHLHRVVGLPAGEQIFRPARSRFY